MQQAFALHLRQVAKVYPAAQHGRVVLTIDNAPWHQGEVIRQVLQEHPHLELYRLPSYSPQMNLVERLWKVLRRRATHNRLFVTVRGLKRALRAVLSYFQTYRQRVLSLIASPRLRSNPPAS